MYLHIKKLQRYLVIDCSNDIDIQGSDMIICLAMNYDAIRTYCFFKTFRYISTMVIKIIMDIISTEPSTVGNK